jgi:hypothetical protein
MFVHCSITVYIRIIFLQNLNDLNNIFNLSVILIDSNVFPNILLSLIYLIRLLNPVKKKHIIFLFKK